MPVDTYITIDNFTMNELFAFKMENPVEGSNQQRSYDGSLRVYSVFFKDQFTLTFPKLTQAQYDQLVQLLSQTGLNALHTVRYTQPKLTRLYDNSTKAGYSINTDVNRIRGKIRFDKWDPPHWPNQAESYSMTLHGMES